MIFDEAYDTALWFIVRADKKNRKEIIEFLKEMPESLCGNIREAISQYRSSKLEMDSQIDDFFHAVSDKNPREFYYFQMDEDGALTIRKEYYDGRTCDDLFELTLYPVSKEYAEKMGCFYSESLGSITDYSNTEWFSDTVGSATCDEREYNLCNTPLGHFVSYGKEICKGDRMISVFKPVSLRKVPRDITLKNLLTKKEANNNN